MNRLTDCLLRAGGEKFNIDDYSKNSSFVTYDIYKKGEMDFMGINKYSGITVVVTRGKNLKNQIHGIISFLKRYRKEIKRLQSINGLEFIYFDIGVLLDSNFLNTNLYLDPKLVAALAKLNIGLNISCYQTSTKK